jgi:hypothetical protein
MKIGSLIVGLLLLAGIVSAQNAPKENSLLWEITGKGITSLPTFLARYTLFVLPTFH